MIGLRCLKLDAVVILGLDVVLPPPGVLGFFLNAISIVSFLTVKEMRNPSNFFVFNLALADISLNVNGLIAAYASYLRYATGGVFFSLYWC